MKNRKRQRRNRRLKHREELLETRNAYGYQDLTPYQAVLKKRQSEKAFNQPPANAKVEFLCQNHE